MRLIPYPRSPIPWYLTTDYDFLSYFFPYGIE